MIDFRYHLISIVAVLLALSIGVVLGSGLVGEPLLEDIKSNVATLEKQLDERRAEIAALDSQISGHRQFAEEAAPYLLDGVLRATNVVLVEIDGVDGGVVRDMRESIGQAGGTVVTRIEINERVVLEDQTDRDSLALTLNSLVQDEPDVLRIELARTLGEMMAAAASDGRSGGSSATAAVNNLDSLLERLSTDDYITVETADEGRTVPLDAAFVIIGGADEEAPYDVGAFVTELSRAATSTTSPLLVSETGSSEWGMVLSILDDGEVRERVATATGVDDPVGRVATVLGLARAIDGEPDHYGRGSGASSIIPEPTAIP